MSTQGTPNTQPVKTKSKAYSSTVAIQGDAAKYRLKYKELKKKVREIETENDKLHLKTLRVKRNIQRMRLERAILYERLEAETQYRQPPLPPPHLYEAAPAVPSYARRVPPPPPPPPPPTHQPIASYGYEREYSHEVPPPAPGSSTLRQYTPSASPEESRIDPADQVKRSGAGGPPPHGANW